MKDAQNMNDLKGQLTLRGILIGCVGCIIITAASVYTALKMGALPWPIVFAAIISLFFLKVFSHGKVSLNEANVTHTTMSAGAMVAGGLAFTIPGAWMLGYADEISVADMLIVALSGVILGLVCTALLRKHFIEEAHLEYPIGEAAAQTLIAGNTGGKCGVKLFSAMGLAGIYTALRDWFAAIPTLFLSNITIPGVSFGIYNSPMLLAVGFLVGTTAVIVWFAGALFANFGIIVGGSAAGLWDTSTAQGIVSSLGMGVMMGAGIGVVCKDILPKLGQFFKGSQGASEKQNAGVAQGAKENASEKAEAFKSTAAADASRANATSASRVNIADVSRANAKKLSQKTGALFALAIAAVCLAVCFLLNLGPVVCIVVVLLSFVTCAMSAQSVGQTGIDPMEIFGLIVLLVVAAISNAVQVKLFFVAGIIAVACGLAGDVMNDFRAGHIIGTDPRAQWIGQAIGSIVGALVSVAVMLVLLKAYGAQAFGAQGSFISAQASVVATMVSGIPCVSAFVIGLVLGCVLYLVKFPSMMLGLGIYLPFYMSISAFLGAVAKLIYNKVCKIRRARLANDASVVHETSDSHDTSDSCDANNMHEAGDSHDTSEGLARAQEESGLIVASGLLGGESIVGVLIALAAVVMGSIG